MPLQNQQPCRVDLNAADVLAATNIKLTMKLLEDELGIETILTPHTHSK
jgi:hypothetical protein